MWRCRLQTIYSPSEGSTEATNEPTNEPLEATHSEYKVRYKHEILRERENMVCAGLFHGIIRAILSIKILQNDVCVC